MRVTLHGARGSYPVSGNRYRRYGGSTSCVSVETPTGIIVIDAGTGIASLGEILASRPTVPPITILFTHFHLDHINGLPSFKPFLMEDAAITLMADATQAAQWRQALKQVTATPYWPFALLGSERIRFDDLPTDRVANGIAGPIQLHGVDVSWCQVAHPQGGVSYRLQDASGSVVLGTDREHGDARLDGIFRELSRGADVLLHDAQFTPKESGSRLGWGHSTWEQGARMAAEAGVKRLVLVSHDPSRSDGQIDQIVEQARQVFPETVAGAPDLVVHGGESPEPGSVSSAGQPDPLTFRYAFTLSDGTTRTFTISLDPKTLIAIQPARREPLPEWTALGVHKCANCPLKESESPQCPAAVSLIDVVSGFGGGLSHDRVTVTIDTQARRYEKESSMQQAVSSLIGLCMATSGCPVMGKFRPMVRHHLPFATADETTYRALSMYLLAQYLIASKNGTPDWSLDGLKQLYEGVRVVNDHFSRRLGEAARGDAGVNAVVILDTFADVVSFSIDQKMLEELELLFRSYLE